MQETETVVVAEKRTSKELYADVLTESARLFQVQPDLLHTNRRAPKTLVYARFAVCKAMRLHNIPFKRIGDLMGGRHHTSVMYAVEQANSLIVEDAKFAEKVGLIANLDNKPRPKVDKQQHYDMELEHLDNFTRNSYKATVRTARAFDTIESDIESIKGTRVHFVLPSINGVVFTGTARMAALVVRLPTVDAIEKDGFTFD